MWSMLSEKLPWMGSRATGGIEDTEVELDADQEAALKDLRYAMSTTIHVELIFMLHAQVYSVPKNNKSHCA